MFRSLTHLVSVSMLLAACGDLGSSPDMPLDVTVPEYANLQGGGYAGTEGFTGVGIGWDYFDVYVSYRSAGDSLFAEFYSSLNGLEGSGWMQGNYIYYDSIYISNGTPDFKVWGKIYDSSMQYLGFADETYIDVAIVTASISGPTQIPPNEQCDEGWQANPSGGTSPFSYAWWGALSGSTQTINGTLSSSSYLWVEVTDYHSNKDTAAVFVQVAEAYECEA